MDQSVIKWVKFLDPVNMNTYSDEEIWAAWKGGGEVIIANHVIEAPDGIVAQSETLKNLAAGIHRHVADQRRIVIKYQVVDEPAPPPPPRRPHIPHDFSVLRGAARFCSACGSPSFCLAMRCTPVDHDTRMATMETAIEGLMAGFQGGGKAKRRLERIAAVESGAPPRDLKKWGPRFPVEQIKRRYADVVGGWNKRAVK